MICSGCGNQVNEGARFCSNCGRPFYQETAVPVHAMLLRPRMGRVIAGVCAGFAQRYGWDVILVRILLCVLVIFGCGTPILAYFIAWIVMPNEPYFLPASTVGPPMTPPNSPPTI